MLFLKIPISSTERQIQYTSKKLEKELRLNEICRSASLGFTAINDPLHFFSAQQ